MSCRVIVYAMIYDAICFYLLQSPDALKGEQIAFMVVLKSDPTIVSLFIS